MSSHNSKAFLITLHTCCTELSEKYEDFSPPTYWKTIFFVTAGSMFLLIMFKPYLENRRFVHKSPRDIVHVDQETMQE